MNIKSVIDPRELLEQKSEDSTYDFSNFIKLESFGDRRLSKRKLKLLKAIDPAIRAATDADETVYYITDGVKVRVFEQLFIGWMAYYYNLTAFVFTSKRILLIHLRNKNKRGHYIGSLEYPDIRKVTTSLFGALSIKLINGQSIVFSKVPRKDRIHLRDFLNSVVNTNAPKNKTAKGIRNICPKCFTEVSGNPKSCPSCEIPFKSPAKAALLSLVMPGLGDLYLGSRILGSIELIIMLFIWSNVIIDFSGELQPGESRAVLVLTAVIIFSIIHSLDALKSHYLARKGIIPAQAVQYEGE